MKNISLAWMGPAAFATLCGLAVLPACDVIDNPKPDKATLSAGRRDSLALDSAEAAQATNAVQRVLIEDYTGQYCGNCPRAAHMADSMRLKYPGRVVVTEVHVTDYFAAPRLPHFPLDFRVPVVSQALTQVFDLDNRGLPQGAVNRARFSAANGDPVATYSLWPNVVAEQLTLVPTVELNVISLFDPTTRLLRLKVRNKYLTARPGRKMNLGIIVVEDSLVGAQKDYRLNRTRFPDQTEEQYVHHNVMRAALTGTFGTQQVDGPAAGQQFASYLNYSLATGAAAAWKPRNCSIIAYIADAGTRQIVQVVQVKLL